MLIFFYNENINKYNYRTLYGKNKNIFIISCKNAFFSAQFYSYKKIPTFFLHLRPKFGQLARVSTITFLDDIEIQKINGKFGRAD